MSAPAPAQPYIYRKGRLRFFASVFDRWAPLVLGRRKPQPRPQAFAHIAVIRVDQIGDIVLAVPFLQALRRRYPLARISFITTSAGQALLKCVPGLADVRVFDAPWFSGDRGILQAMRDLRVLLKKIDADAVVDLRGDVRHLWSARRALPGAWIEGYGITGGGFLADHVPSYDPARHAALKNFTFLDVAVPAGPLTIDAAIAGQPLNRRVRDLLPEEKNEPWIAFHIGAGHDSKRWPEDHWKRLTERVSRETSARILWIGDRDADDRARIVLSLLEPKDRERSIVICHQLNLGELGTLLRMCDLLVTHDSGPAHVAAACAVPTLVLFSLVNNPAEWRPLSPRAEVIAGTPAGMHTIDPDAVFTRLRILLP